MALSPFEYKNEGLHQILNEKFICPSNDDRIYLLHDNCSNISLYTGENNSGTNLTSNITVANDEIRPYRTYIKLDLSTRTTYAGQELNLNYTSTGEIMDDMLIQELRDEIIRLSEIIDNSSSTVPLSIQSTIPADGAIDGSSTAKFTANKWLKKSQTNKFKCFPTLVDRTNGTNEVSSTVTMSGDDEYTWQATSSLNPSSQYFFRVYNGLIAIDGSQLESDFDFSYTTASNQSPTVSVDVTNNGTTIGSTLTATTTIGSDPEGDTVSSTTYEWLRNDVVISGATASTYVIAEADLGTTLKARATVDMSTGADPSPATSSGTAIPVHNPPSISVSAGNTQNTISFTQNSTLNTETYNLYWSTTSGVTKSNGTKITGVTSPHTHSTLTNGMTYYYVLTMVVNGVESADSAQVSGIPVENLAPVTSNIQTANISTSGFNVSGDITNIGASDFISKIQVAYIDESVDGVIATVGLDTAANSAVTAGRYFDITNSTDITNFQNHSTKYAKTGLTLTAGKTYVPAVRTEESDVA